MEVATNIVAFPQAPLVQPPRVVRLRDRKALDVTERHHLGGYLASKAPPPATVELLLALVEVLDERTPNGGVKRGSVKERLFHRVARKLQTEFTPGRVGAINVLCGCGGGEG